MKKNLLLNITLFGTLFIVLISFLVDDGKSKKPELDVKKISSKERVQWRFIPMACGYKSGNSTKETICEIPCTVSEIMKDSVMVKVTENQQPWNISTVLKKPKVFSKQVGDSITIVATQWSGAYEGDWFYELK